ncbi:MAG: rhodanese-like domain-containing protein [Desulfobulbus sp.]
MKKRIAIFLGCFILCGAGIVKAEAPVQPKWINSPVNEWVSKARKETKQISVADLKAAMDHDEDMIILDVREPNEYNVAHIPDSINIPRGLLEFSIWSVAPDKKETIFVYCKTGARAALATKALNELGYENAFAISTGADAWMKAGYPVKTSISDEQFFIVPAVEK